MRKTIRLLLPLLLAAMWPTTFARAQELAASTAISVTSPYESETARLLQRYIEISALPVAERRSFFGSSSASEKSNLRRIHLALHLVKWPELNQRQVRIILDGISLSSAEFFAAADGTPAEKAKANDALKSLARRAHATFLKNEAAELFATVAGGVVEDEMLQKYNDVSALPLAKRKAFFRNATPKDKSDLWRTHLALFLAKRPDLNDWQREIILSAMTLTSPGWFEVGSTDTAWKARVADPLRTLEERIRAAFSLEEGAKIFATLGDSTEVVKRRPARTPSVLLSSVDYKWASDSNPYQQWTVSRYAMQDMEIERSACQCSTDSDWCPIFGHCNGANCNPTPSGCGTLWRYECNGASCE